MDMAKIIMISLITIVCAVVISTLLAQTVYPQKEDPYDYLFPTQDNLEQLQKLLFGCGMVHSSETKALERCHEILTVVYEDTTKILEELEK